MFQLTDEAPQSLKRLRRSSFSADEIAAAEVVVGSWRNASFVDYATARAAKSVVSDGQPYATRKEAQKAAGHIRSLLQTTLGTDHRGGTLVTLTGKHPKAANAFGWAIWYGVYSAPKPRAPRMPKVAAPVAATK